MKNAIFLIIGFSRGASWAWGGSKYLPFVFSLFVGFIVTYLILLLRRSWIGRQTQ